MRDKFIRVFREFVHLIKRLPMEWKIVCFCLSSLVAIATVEKIHKIFVENYDLILRILIFLGILLFITGCCLYFLKFRRNQRELDPDLNDVDSTEESNSTQSRNIHTGGGNYNESIAGDYVGGNYTKIQGNYVVNQNFSEVVDKGSSELFAKILESIAQLTNQGCSQENAEIRVTDELAEEVRQNPKLKRKLSEWNKDFGHSNTRTNDETEIAREIVESATNYRQTYSSHFTEVTDVNFQKLDKLLRAEKWKEADRETTEIIFLLSSQELGKYYQEYTSSLGRYYLKGQNIEDICLTKRHIGALLSKDLNTINHLWLRYSNNKFGFSLQKQIWESIVSESEQPNLNNNVYNNDNLKNFGKVVGWHDKSNWLYYSDMEFSHTAPHGHLPIMIFLEPNNFSERCHVNSSIFKPFVERVYKN